MADQDDDDEIEEKIPSPEELLSDLMSEERALQRIVESPDPRRLANFLQATVFPLMKDMLRVMATRDESIEALEDAVYIRSTLQPQDAQKLHRLLDKAGSLFDSAKEMLPLAERDEFQELLGAARRIVIRAEEEEGDDDEGDEAVALAPEIPRASDA